MAFDSSAAYSIVQTDSGQELYEQGGTYYKRFSPYDAVSPPLQYNQSVDASLTNPGNATAIAAAALAGMNSRFVAPSGDTTGAIDTAAIQAALNLAATYGAIEVKLSAGASYYLNGTLIFSYSKSALRGNRTKLYQVANQYRTFAAYAPGLAGLLSGADAPAGYASGIGAMGLETLMYSESTDRITDIAISGIDYVYSGTGATYGRLIDFFSVDRPVIADCTVASNGNGVNFWYCRDSLLTRSKIAPVTTASGFAVFLFKSHGRIDGNEIVGGFHAVEVKGCYPQAGKTNYQAFDTGYSFYNPVKITRNEIRLSQANAIQVGYYDNSSGDISTNTAGVTQKAWFGEVWGCIVEGNTFSYPGTVSANASENRCFRTNINAKYCSFINNIVYDQAIEIMGSTGIDVSGNVIYNSRADSTAAVVLRGLTIGAGSMDATKCSVRNNRIYSSPRVSIELNGGQFNVVENNDIIDGATTFQDILVRSTTATQNSSRSIRNVIRGNRSYKAPTDYVYPIKATGCDYSVVDGNFAFGGFYNGNGCDSDAFNDAHYKRAIVFVETPTSYVGSAGTNYVGDNYGDANTSVGAMAGYSDEMMVPGSVQGGRYRQHIRMGKYALWVDSSDRLRIKVGKPTTDTDGTVVGTQS